MFNYEASPLEVYWNNGIKMRGSYYKTYKFASVLYPVLVKYFDELHEAEDAERAARKAAKRAAKAAAASL